MQWYKRLNPLNYLVGKIFLMFWAMITITLLALIIISSQVEMQMQDKPIPSYVYAKIDALQEHMARMQHHGRTSFERFAQSRRVGRNFMLLYAKSGEKPKSSKPLPDEFDVKRLAWGSDDATTLIESNYLSYGPFKVTSTNNEYELFILNKFKPHPMMRFHMLPTWVRWGLPLSISAMLSFFVAMSLAKPINSLRNAHRAFAEGNLDTRSNGVAKRNDELGQLGKDFDNMAQKVSQLLAAQKRLLGDVSHELRSPLARLQIALGLAAQPDCKDLPRHLQRIELETHRLDDMIGDVLRLSRLESQLQNIECFTLSLTSLLEYVIKDANFEANGANKEVKLTAIKDITVKGDQGLLASAFENVVRNAVKYTEQNTTVLVTMSLEDTWVAVKVRDFGPGVPTSALSQLFQPFYRVSDSRQRSSGGTGLGLAIAEKSIRSHDGTIMAHNHEDKGLEITIKLPLYQGNPV
jgi:two-component system sensor histidine kinase CpxA